MAEVDLNTLSLPELEGLFERESKELEVKLLGATQLEARELHRDHYALDRALRAKQREHYRSLDLPEILPDLTALTLEELRRLEKLLGLKLYAMSPSSAFAPDDLEAANARRSALVKQNRSILDAIDRLQAASYKPGPHDPPAYEPRGYSAMRSFVKSQSENNLYYLDQWEDHPWYPAIFDAHVALEELIPGYNISQIKEKFGTLRYYIDFPESVENGDWPGIVPEDIRSKADAIILEAEQRAVIISDSLKNRD